MKETFVFRHKWLELFKESELTGDEIAAMLEAIVNYVQSGEITTFTDRTMKSVYKSVVDELSKDIERYEETCRKRRESGKKGGRPKKANGSLENQMVSDETEENQKVFSESKQKQKNPDYDYDNEYDYDNDIYIIEYIDVELYFKRMGYKSDPMQFHKFYEAKNWYRGKIDWRELAKNWEDNKTKPPNKSLNYQQRTESYAELERMLANS